MYLNHSRPPATSASSLRRWYLAPRSRRSSFGPSACGVRISSSAFCGSSGAINPGFIGLSDLRGSKRADLVIHSTGDVSHLPYHAAVSHADTVLIAGQVVLERHLRRCEA